MTITGSKSGMRNPRKNLKPTATSMSPKKRPRKGKTEDKSTKQTLDARDNMIEDQQESSLNEHLVNDSPSSPELLEKNSSMEQESVTNRTDISLRNKTTRNNKEVSKTKN